MYDIKLFVCSTIFELHEHYLVSFKTPIPILNTYLISLEGFGGLDL